MLLAKREHDVSKTKPPTRHTRTASSISRGVRRNRASQYCVLQTTRARRLLRGTEYGAHRFRRGNYKPGQGGDAPVVTTDPPPGRQKHNREGTTFPPFISSLPLPSHISLLISSSTVSSLRCLPHLALLSIILRTLVQNTTYNPFN